MPVRHCALIAGMTKLLGNADRRSLVELGQFDGRGTRPAHPAVEGVLDHDGTRHPGGCPIERDHVGPRVDVVLTDTAPAEAARAHCNQATLPAIHSEPAAAF